MTDGPQGATTRGDIFYFILCKEGWSEEAADDEAQRVAAMTSPDWWNASTETVKLDSLYDSVVGFMDGVSRVPDPFVKQDFINRFMGLTGEAELGSKAHRRATEKASAAQLMLEHKKTGRPLLPPLSRSGLRRTGEMFYRLGYAKAPGKDKEAIDAMMLAGAEQGGEMRLLLETESGQALAISTSRWVRFAMPVVRYVGHRYAAALMATSVPSGVEVHPPWGTFLIEMPNDMVFVSAPGAERNESVSFVFATQITDPGIVVNGEPSWIFLVMTRNHLTLHRIWVPLSKITSLSLDDGWEAFPEGGMYSLDTVDERAMELIGRLVLGTCLAMAEPSNVRQIGGPGSPRHHRDPHQEPDEPRVYEVGHTVTVDCREPLREFNMGIRRNALTVQFMVKGHWRQQACGPKLTERKTIWVSPYWKGPTDGPVLIRDHVLSRSPVSAEH